ncbi:DNA polymerase IV [Endozoicomonas sp. G2_2]|uniref:DNA polymerase Y family protein n=1 Tax=Endozoicomonas sp. G2_2 TaxID=2821092 RepID=UPI001ADC8C67|nr:DNA polymerase IV [Endozoicomonas sp. G2_2]MBO9471485.1 DNA polymerase IV [Endozoicomonas sp. G2_2]
MNTWQRMICLWDGNAFFAAIAQMDNPTLRGRPIAITNGMKGTAIITCSYEARAYGITTGMRLREARKLCPELIQVPSQPERYAEVSTAIMDALQVVSPDTARFSVDEGFIDLTRVQRLHRMDAYGFGRWIKRVIFDASGLLCSVGISGDKTTAKYAAKLQKPDGLTVIEPDVAEARLADVPVTDLCGISDGIGAFLAARGVHRCGQMKNIPISALAQRFGNPGRRLWLMAQAKDPEPVMEDTRPAKTIGHGKVVPPDTRSRELIETYLMHMAEKVGRRLRRNVLEAQTFSIGLRTDLGTIGAKARSVTPTDDGAAIYALARGFLSSRWDGQGVSQVQINALDPRPRSQQADLFAEGAHANAPLNTAIDEINARFGGFTVHRAPLLARSETPDVIAPSWQPGGSRDSIGH